MSGGSLSAAAEDEHRESTTDLTLISVQDRKDEALFVLKEDLMNKLSTNVKSLDDDIWMFNGPRSHIHFISRPGGVLYRCSEILARGAMAPQMIFIGRETLPTFLAAFVECALLP